MLLWYIDTLHAINQIIKKKIKIIVGTYTLGGVLIDLGYAAKIAQNGVYSAKSIKKTHIQLNKAHYQEKFA